MRALTVSYGGVWGATMLGAAIVLAGGQGLAASTRRALGLRLHGGPRMPLGHVATLVAHNLPIAAWPLLLATAGADRGRFGRSIGDTLLVASVAANTLPVGAALGAYGPALISYVPQLPLEWAALAIGAASWLVQRERGVGRRERVAWFAAITVSVIVAAALETFAVPHH